MFPAGVLAGRATRRNGRRRACAAWRLAIAHPGVIRAVVYRARAGAAAASTAWEALTAAAVAASTVAVEAEAAMAVVLEGVTVVEAVEATAVVVALIEDR